MKPPCKDCPDRVLGCHSTCEKYIAFDRYRKQISAARQHEWRLNDNLWRISRNSKYRKRKK